VGTLGSTALKHFLETRRSAGLDKIRKEHLLKMLSGEKFTWRSMENLCSAIGEDEETTAALLLEIGARKSQSKGKDNWALISRVPFPDDTSADTTGWSVVGSFSGPDCARTCQREWHLYRPEKVTGALFGASALEMTPATLL